MTPNADYLNRLLAYDRWANREAFESIRDGKLHRSRKLFAHIVSLEWRWLSRLTQVDYAGVTWPEWTFEECYEQMQALESAWADCIAQVVAADPDRRISYTSRDVVHQIPAADVVTHVVLHSSYHRGQIAIDQRLAGQGPPFTDFMECIQKGMLDPGDAPRP